jgi:hypothetical protein
VIGFSPDALKALFASAASRSGNAQASQRSAMLPTAAAFVARIASVIWCNGRVSPFESKSTIARSALAVTSSGVMANKRSLLIVASRDDELCAKRTSQIYFDRTGF